MSYNHRIMKIVDTHCHLDFKDFDADRDAVLGRAVSAGVERIINVGSSLEGSRRAVALAGRYDMVYATVGIHPHDAGKATEGAFGEISRLAGEPKVVAIGEVGLDYYRNLSPKDSQIAVFRRFIELANALNLPLIVHAREANDDILNILRATNNERRTTIMHCFSGDEIFLRECLDLGLYVSFTCNLTFKNAGKLRETARTVPLDRLLLETDAPYLAPEGMRGKRNEPAFMTALLGQWADLSGFSANDIARITTHNANTLFRLGLDEPSKIAYEIRDSLYFNITNECTNECSFCVRNSTDFVKGHNLRLDKEPDAHALLNAATTMKKYKEVVFCGYGEPTARLETVKSVAKVLKEKNYRTRLVTNGHGDLINGRKIAPELAGIVDKVSVSLNTDKEDVYMRMCRPRFGPGTYKAVLDFIRDCVASGIETEVTCLDLPGTDLGRCEEAARLLGASFRPRRLGVAG